MLVFWLCAFVAFAVGEGITVGLVSIWFAIGAMAAMIATALGGGLWLQIVVFLGVSALSLLLFKPLSSKMFQNKVDPTNADRVIGKVAVVTQLIDNAQAKGQVQVEGQIWSARSAYDVVLPVDTQVRILRIEGVKLIVEAV